MTSSGVQASDCLNDRAPLELSLRNAPIQARSRERLRRVLDAAERGPRALRAPTASRTTPWPATAGVSVGTVYRFFPDKQAIVEALAVRYWSDFEDLVAGVAEADAREPRGRSRPTPCCPCWRPGSGPGPGFLALWYGGLRTEQVRDATRDARQAIAGSIEQILSAHWPDAPARRGSVAAAMVVLAGDGLLREAFRRDPAATTHCWPRRR